MCFLTQNWFGCQANKKDNFFASIQIKFALFLFIALNGCHIYEYVPQSSMNVGSTGGKRIIEKVFVVFFIKQQYFCYL